MLKASSFSMRLIREKDLDRLFALLNDVSNKGPYYPVDLVSEPDFLRKFQETGFWTDEFGRLLIVDDTDNILGGIHYFMATPYYSGLEIGYLLFDSAIQGRGIMTEALTLFSGYLFRTREINRLELKIHPDNSPSMRVAEKVGFTFEGVARQCVRFKEAFADLHIYSLLRKEYYQTLGNG